MRRSLALLVLLVAAAGASEASPSDVDSLLQLKGLLATGDLATWQAGSDPCAPPGWQGIACDTQGRVTAIDVSSAGLSGALPADWQPPATTTLLDLTGTRALCGGLPASVAQRSLAGSLQVRTAGSSVEQPCGTDRALSSPATTAAGAPPSDGSAPEGSTGGLTDVAKGLIGMGVGLGALAGAAAGTVLLLRKRRAQQDGVLLSNDLARRVCDSVVVTKRKQHPAAALNAAADVHATAAPPKPKAAPSLRVVAFADGTASEPEDAGKPEEQQHRLRASVVQDSVVIIRNRATAGALGLHKQPSASGSRNHGSSDADAEPAACLPPVSSTGAGADGVAGPQQQQQRFAGSTSSMRRVQFSVGGSTAGEGRT